MDEVIQKPNIFVANIAYVFVSIIFLCIGIFFGVLIADYSKSVPKCGIEPITNYPTPPTNEGVMCTADAMVCPDGSAVGRVPPNCEFAPCPDEPSIKITPLPPIIDDNGTVDSNEAGWGKADPSGLGGM